MAFLTENPAEIMPAVKKSPFWAGTYGGYSFEQVEFFKRNLGSLEGKQICDPMSGQAFHVCQMSWHGARVQLCDINAGALALASLRDPVLLRVATPLIREVTRTLRKLQRKRAAIKREHCQDWISPRTAKELQEFANVFGLEPRYSPLRSASPFWRQTPLSRLVLGLLVLASRSITCFRTSDNSTWLKAGGITPGMSVLDAFEQSLQSWSAFSENVQAAITSSGKIGIHTWNCEMGRPTPSMKNLDAIVVSPPYANRLDYSLLWAPELAVVSSTFEDSARPVKVTQMGTTVVKNRWPADDDVRKLPKPVFAALQDIRQDPTKASECYYYPFFANYAISLARSVESWCSMIRKRGQLLVIVRDTVRKDHLFPTDVIVRQTAKQCGVYQINPDESPHIIRSHIGLMRQRRAKASLHGLAQREWMLAFTKE